MKRNQSIRKSIFIAVIVPALIVSFFSISCAKKDGSSESANTIEIKEKMFVAQVSDVYNNPDDYFGKTIKLEGILKKEQYYQDEDPYCFVIRYGPNCCGYDGNVGFEIRWDEENAQQYPEAESWVEAIGVLKSYEEDGYMQYLYLDLSSLNVLRKRGSEVVLQ